MKTDLIDNRQIRVFISSTFQDMQDERDYLMKRTFPILRKLAAERDVTLTELDLRWGITEEESRSGKVVEICLREIENSIPFFIGIIGNRYGWVPEKNDISENVTDRFKDVDSYLERHLSVTEMEMQFGVLQRQEDMHAFFYIKEGEGKEDADNPEMLERLKKEVKASRYPSSTYSSPEDLAQQVEKAFTALLDQLFPEGHLSELEKERIGQRSFMNQLCQNYIQDAKNFQVIDEWMSDWNQHQLVITGASGLGKSALIANWLKEKLTDENRDYNIIYHFTGNGGSECSHEQIMKVLIDEINDVYGWEPEKELNKSQEDKLNELFIRVASEGKKPLLIVFDAINQIIDTDNAKLLNWLPIPPKSIKILFSTLEDDRTMEVFRNRHYPEFVLQPLEINSRKQLVINYLHLYGKKLTDQQVEHITTDKQCENTLVLKTLLDELINFGVYEKLDERIEYYLSQDAIEDFYQALLQSYEDDYDSYGEDFVKHVLSLIVLSRNGLSEDEILKATDIKPLYWSQFYCAFSIHLVSKEGLISFAHHFVQEAVSARYIHNEDWIHTCRNEILSVVDETNTIRYLEEQTFQLNQLGEYVKLHDLLLDLDTFSTYYGIHPYELGAYWRTLTTKGYSIQEYLKIDGDSETDLGCYYAEISVFSSAMLANYICALVFATKALAIRKKTFGFQNSDTANIIILIGILFYFKGNYTKSLKFFNKALIILEEHLGIKHPDTATLYNSIGKIYYARSYYNKAIQYHLKALKIWENDLGINNQKTALAYNNIGLVYYQLGNFDIAMEHLQKALKIREKMLGRDHPDTADSFNDIGLIFNEQRDYDHALQYHLKALEIRQKILGLKHTYTANSYNNVGLAYKNKGDNVRALDYYLIALDIKIKVLGLEHVQTANTYNNIGCVYSDFGDCDKALEYHKQALEIREKVLGKEHPDIATSYNNIGCVYSDLGDYDKALEYHKQALEIREKVLGKEHPNTAGTNYNIGYLYDKRGDYDKALEYYELAAEKGNIFALNQLGVKYRLGQGVEQNDEKAFELYLKAAEGGLSIAQSNLGWMYANGCGTEQNYEKAIEWYKKSAEQGYKETFNGIAWTYHLMGKYEEALPWAQKAIAAYPNNPGIKDTLATVYQGLGRYSEAMNQFDLCLKLQREQGATEESIQETEAKITELKELMK